jgi:hypothetical protein
MSKGAVNDGGDGEEMKIASGEFSDPLTSKIMVSPKCGDKSQHIRLRARSRSSTSPTEERYYAETDSQCRSPQKSQMTLKGHR